MIPKANLSHTATALIEAPARTVFAFLADPYAVGNWALAGMRTQPTDSPAIYSARSLFDGTEIFFKVAAHPELLLVQYSVGIPHALVPRIQAQVIEAASMDIESSSSYLILTAWRPPGMSDARWQRLQATHDVEVWLIKEQIEAAMRPLQPGAI
jgi:hypothetical protein